MKYNHIKAPWWQKAIGIAAIGLIASFVKHEINNHHRSIEDDLDDLDEKVSDLEDKVAARNATKKSENSCPHVQVESKNLSDCLQSDCTLPYVPIWSSWITEGQNAIIFSGTDQGKTSLAMQIALDMARGRKSQVFEADTFGYKPLKVIYYNGELDEGDLKHRFPDMTIADGLDFDISSGNPFGTVENFLSDVKERVCGLAKPCAIFIDNITKYFPTFQAESARMFFSQMEDIQAAVKKQNPGASLTFVLVAHTTKDDGGPAKASDVIGSGNLGNFAKSMIYLGPTQDGMVKYLKLVKAKHHPTGDPVIVVKKLPLPYWHFEYIAKMTEKEAMNFGSDDLEKLSPTEPKPRGRKQKVSDEQILEVKRKADGGFTVADAIKSLNLDITEKTYYERVNRLTPEEV